MKIDLPALKAASEGDPKAKVAVTKGWLRAVHDELAKRPAPSTGGRFAEIFEDILRGRS